MEIMAKFNNHHLVEKINNLRIFVLRDFKVNNRVVLNCMVTVEAWQIEEGEWVN